MSELNATEMPTPKGGDEIRLNFKFKKKHLIIAGAVLTVLLLGILGWKLSIYNKFYGFIFKANAEVSIIDKSTNSNLAADVEFVNKDKKAFSKKTKTDSSGKVNVKGLVKGTYDVKVSSLGYFELNQSTNLKRGSNSVSLSLTKVPPKQASVTGSVKNYVSNEGVDKAKVTVGKKTVESFSNGQFNMDKLNLEEYDVTVEKAGFNTYTGKVKISEVNKKLDDIKLVPEGKVLFSSNRDKGKSGIFTANYDGSEQKALTPRIGDSEDFSPLVSPDNKKVAFLSNREGKKERNSLVNNLFVIDMDGNNLVKASELSSGKNFRWVNSSSKIFWQSYSNNIDSSYFYDLASGENKQLGAKDQSLYNQMISSAEDRVVFSQAGLYYWAFINNPESTNQILKDKTGLNFVKFEGDVLTYSEYNQSDRANKYYTYNIGSGATQEIEYTYSDEESFVSSSNEDLKAYISNRDGKRNIFVSDLSGNNERKLTTIDTAQWPISWSLDGDMILFNVSKTGESALYVVSTKGGEAKKVVDVYSGGYMY